MYTDLLVVHTIVVLFLIMMVLIQRTDSDGMSGLGGGGNQFLSGRSTANLMTRTTAILAGIFMLSSLVLAIMVSRMTERSIIDAVPAVEEQAPVTTDGAANDNAAKQQGAPGKLIGQKEAKPKQAPAVPKPE